MTTITSLGVGSGLDVEGLVTKLMAVEKQPLTALSTKEATYNAKISALGSLKSAISDLETAAKAFIPAIGLTAQQNLATYSATLNDATVGSATADSAASSSVGEYSLTVVQTARADRLTFTNPVTLTAGTMTIGVGAASFSVTTTAGMTLSDLRNAINSASGSAATATLIGGTQLVLTSNTGGAANRISVSGTAGVSWDAGTSTGTGISQLPDNVGRDAQITLNGVSLTSSTNTFTDAVDGVDITLKANAVVGATATVNVTADNSTKVTDTVNAFVKAYNAFVAQIKKYGYYDAATKTAGTLQGDYTLRSTQSQMYKLVTATPTGVTGSITSLSNLGISVQSDGTLAADSTKLSSAVSSRYTDVTNYLSALGSDVKSAGDALMASTGMFTSATDSLNAKIKDVGNRRDALNTRLITIEARYRKQFAALDTLISSMTATSTYLTQQLAALTSTNSSK